MMKKTIALKESLDNRIVKEAYIETITTLIHEILTLNNFNFEGELVFLTGHMKI